MGLEYEEYARQLSQLEMENAAKAGYDNQEVQDYNNQPEPEERQVEMAPIDKAQNRRNQQQQIKKAPKAEDNWGDDMDPNMLGLWCLKNDDKIEEAWAVCANSGNDKKHPDRESNPGSWI